MFVIMSFYTSFYHLQYLQHPELSAQSFYPFAVSSWVIASENYISSWKCVVMQLIKANSKRILGSTQAKGRILPPMLPYNSCYWTE